MLKYVCYFKVMHTAGKAINDTFKNNNAGLIMSVSGIN